MQIIPLPVSDYIFPDNPFENERYAVRDILLPVHLR